MEKAGFVTLMDRVIGEGVNIGTVSMDRQNQIRKLMRTDPNYKNINHAIDPWHLIKGIKKKLNVKAKKKGCEVIGKKYIIILFNSLLFSSE